MKRQKIDNSLEQRFVLAMITSRDFLVGLRGHFDVDLIEAPHLRKLAQWCVDYFETYDKSPGATIESLYFSWLQKQETPDPDAEALRDVLSDLSSQYEAADEVNAAYLLDELGVYISSRKLQELKDDLDDRLCRGDVVGAVQEVQRFRAPEVGRTAGIDPLNQEEVWATAFGEGNKPLIEFSGDAGKFLNPAMTREALVGIQAPEKRGKTFWCMEFLIQALLQRRKVAFFQVGDLSEPQVLRRFGSRIASKPLWESQCGVIKYPAKIDLPSTHGAAPTVVWTSKTCPYPLSESACLLAIPRFFKKCGIPPDRPYLMMSNHPTMTANVRDIEIILDQWEVEREFIPDVVIIDYADILAPENSRTDGRDRYNETWAAMRRLSQERRCLVVTPTQADTGSYEKRIQSMKNFSEDKRKLSHVTGMLGLNQDDREKESQIMRLNWIVQREFPHQTRQCLYTGNCVPLGRMMTCSKLLK